MQSIPYKQLFSQLSAVSTAASSGLRSAHALSAVPAAAEDFFATKSVDFSGLGLDEEVCRALESAGYSRPAHAQVRQWHGGQGRPHGC
jgi:hypothetical protein